VTDPADTCDGLDEPAASAPAPDMPPDVPALKVFYLYLTAGCNLHCRHCWITPTFVQGKPVPAECLDLGRLKGAVAEGKPMGLSAAKLTGGEPMLHPKGWSCRWRPMGRCWIATWPCIWSGTPR
jgi:pyruvate-formate lyase-activating enzyme